MWAALLAVAASAAPPAVLGPDGPLWLGPLPPGERGDLVVVVDPWSGRLIVEGAEDGEPGDPTVVRDEAGAVSALVWADGSWIVPRLDEQGRVRELDGPGRGRWRFRWGDRVEVLDPLGRATTLRAQDEPDGGVRLEVEDANGRVARTWYGPARRDVRAWEDPRGLRTTLREDGAALRVEDAVGRAWTLVRDPAGRVLELTLPGGGLWRWERDEQGRVTRVSDPAGRPTRWDRDAAGRVVAVVRGGQPWRLERDEAGRLRSLDDPAGGRIQLRRDDSGRVVSILDAAGEELRLARGPGGWPTSLLEATGGRWSLDLDLLGRPAGVADPSGRRVRLERDGSGKLAAVRDSRGRSVRLRWSASGLLSRLEDSRGRALSMLRDALGRLEALRWGEGEELRLWRDMAGDVVRVGFGEERWEIRRDALGLPLSAGPVRWSRDGGGRVIGVEAPGIALALDRDASGLIRRARAEGWELEIGRDALGRPVRWSGPEGTVELTRDPSGRPRAERGLASLALERDPRGLVTRLVAGELEWRWLRDAAGRPLRVSGPRDLSVGVDWDEAGRPLLLRGPSGALTRWIWDGLVALQSFADADGGALDPGEPSCDGVWSPDGPDAWRWESADGCASPIRPWGLSGDRVALSRGEDGVVERVVGPEGSVALRRDALGRLVGLEPDQGRGGWRFGYDARGRLARVRPPSGREVPLIWSPEGAIWPDSAPGAQLLLATGEGGARAWIAGPAGLVGAAEQGWSATLLPDAQGSPIWVLLGEEAPALVHTGLGGLPDAAAAGLAGARGALQAWPGGPLFAASSAEGWRGAGEVAVDPLGGARLDARDRWPWGEEPGADRLDPERWAPDSAWHAPLRLLEALGGLEPIDAGRWHALADPEPALGWLPASLDRERAPLGPDPASLPLDEDPLTAAILLRLVEGKRPLETGFVLDVALREAVDLPRLPPGVPAPTLRE